jgi:hypothetical protein
MLERFAYQLCFVPLGRHEGEGRLRRFRKKENMGSIPAIPNWIFKASQNLKNPFHRTCHT